MKITLFLVLVSASIGVIYSQASDCRDASDCTHVTCDSSSTLACSHGACTCLVATNPGTCHSATCAARADCDSCQCRDTHDQHHCFDGFCQCGNGPHGPGGPGGPGGVGK